MLLAFACISAFAQSSERPNQIEIRYGAQDSFGPFENDSFPFGIGNGDNWDDVYKLNYFRYINDFLDIGTGITAGSVQNMYDDEFSGSGTVNNLLDRGSVVDLDLLLRYKFFNGLDLSTTTKIDPFLYLGASGTYVSELEQVLGVDNGFSTNVPVGLGLMGGSDRYKLNVMSGMRFGMWDKIPNRWEHSVGIGFGFGPPKAEKEVEIDVPMPEPVEEEVVMEEVIEEPMIEEEVIIVADTDGDGIPDTEDDCPNVAGTVGGCPDTDGDGVLDMNDDCPEIAGVVSGCPDADGDGIADKDDNCPDTAGIAGNDGCPEVKDADGDGIPDAVDGCPTVAGVASNNGCPEVKQETVERLAAIAKQIQFQTNSTNLTTNSKTILNEVASIMAANPGYRLSIEGHTDSVGAADFNQGLSERRAAAVRDYLASRGVGSVSSTGYGENRPIATNDTATGRAQNRRVELKLNPR